MALALLLRYIGRVTFLRHHMGGKNLNAFTKSNIMTGFAFCIFFVVLTEKITLVNLIVGALLSFGMVIFYKTPSTVQRYINIKTLFKWPIFAAVLFFEVIKANFQVAGIVLSPKIKVEPHIVTYKTTLKEPWLQTLLANAITLTPGTMTVTKVGQHLRIHCLNKAYAMGLEKMKLEALLIDIEKVIS